MRPILFPFALCLAGCAQLPDSTRVTVVATPASVLCGAPVKELPVRLTIHNGGSSLLRFQVDREVGPPYELSWVDRRVLSSASEFRDTDWEHGGVGQGPIPKAAISIQPGDTTEFTAPLYAIQAQDYDHAYRIELRDHLGTRYYTQSFLLCGAAAKPQP